VKAIPLAERHRNRTNARIGHMLAGVYVHIPFCQVRCSYCDFNTYAGLGGTIPAYTAALCREIELVAQGASQAGVGMVRADSVYFGGGTPSLLPAREVEAILEGLRRNLTVMPTAEITMEANPGTVDLDRLSALRALGTNRLSFGVQSAQVDELRLLERLHTFDQAVQAVAWARQAGFENLNLDLIYGIMGQTLASWQDSLHRALDLNPEHLSLYSLTVESGTPMQARVQAGELPMPDPDLAADMYEWARDELRSAGYRHYEISNWARSDPRDESATPAFACRHNLGTWRLQPYLGLGAGAHGFVPGWRYSNVRHPEEYVRRIQSGEPSPFPFSPAVAETLEVDAQTERREMLLLGLRLVEEGVGERTFDQRFGVGLEAAFGDDLAELQGQGLLEWAEGRVRLTRLGHLLGNRVFVHFI
jgi:putative oxygen-independent coproporphyrinogen III oxidase